MVERDGSIDEAGTVTPFVLWPHLGERAAAWQQGASEVVLKARQIGLSTLAQAYAVHTAQRGGRVLVISKSEPDGLDFLRKAMVIHDHLPPGILAVAASENAHEVAFTSGGRITVKAPTKDAGRSQANQLVIVDEAAFHPWAHENYKAYRPTISAGGQLLIISTANGASGFFYEMYRKAAAGETGYAAEFIPWHARPGRDEQWLARERDAFAGLPGEFAQEYPETADEAFVAHSGLVYGMDEQGVRIFGHQNVVEARTPWGECRWRIAGLDPGGSDPTGLVALGVGEDDRMHVHATRRLRGAVTLEQIADYLSRWDGLDAVVVDAPPQSTIVATLRGLGIPAYGAVKDKSFGIGLVTAALRRRDLTVEPGLGDLEQEFHSYWWAERRANTVGGNTQIQTTTPAEHHADLLDALRYAVVEAVKGAWRVDGQRVAHEKRQREERMAQRRHGQKATTVTGWDVSGRAKEGQWR